MSTLNTRANTQNSLDSGGGGGVPLSQQREIISQSTAAVFNKNKLKSSAAEETDGFLSTSPDSANGETLPRSLHSAACSSKMQPSGSSKGGLQLEASHNIGDSSPSSPIMPPPVYLCTNSKNCVSLKIIVDSFKAPLSEEQAWALIFQLISMYRRFVSSELPRHVFNDLEIPDSMDNISLHSDGSVHCSWSDEEWKKKELKMKQEKEQLLHQNPEQGEEERGMFRVQKFYISRQIYLA